MSSIALVNILSADQPGLVAAIADHLFTEGVNLRDTTFAALGRGGEFTSVCELPAGLDAAALQRGLTALPVLQGAEVSVVPYAYDAEHGPMGRISHEIEVVGGDQLGLIARLAEIFARYGANIVRLDAQKLPESEGGSYVTRFAVSLAPDSAEQCLATVHNTAGSLRLSSRVKEVRR